MADDDTHESALDGNAEDEIVVEGEDGDDVDVETEAAADEAPTEDPELEAIKQRVKEMEEEAEKLKEMQSQVEKQMMSPAATTPGGSSTAFPTWEEKAEADARSVHVSNVDYGATAEELEGHFHGCGAVNRITILCDKWTGHPKGFAYIEFADKDAVQTAVGLDESLFRGRQIKVTAKRTNRPGVSSSNRIRRFRRGGYRPSYGGYYAPRPRRFRRRSAVWYSPY